MRELPFEAVHAADPGLSPKRLSLRSREKGGHAAFGAGTNRSAARAAGKGE